MAGVLRGQGVHAADGCSDDEDHDRVEPDLPDEAEEFLQAEGLADEEEAADDDEDVDADLAAERHGLDEEAVP